LLNSCHVYSPTSPMFVITNLDPVFVNGFNVIFYFAGNSTGNHPGGQYSVSSYAGPTTNSALTQSLNWALYGTNVLTNALGGDWTAPNVFVQGAYVITNAWGSWETNWANYLVYSNLSGGAAFFYTTLGSYQGPSAIEIVANNNGSGLAATTSALSSSTNYASLGTLVTFTNTVSAAPPNGDFVIFMDGSTVLGYTTVNGGVATLTTSALAAGNHNITASYAGNATNAQGSTSSVLTYIVTSGTQSISTPVVLPSSGVMAGANVTVICSTYTGMPAYVFQWQHSGNGVTYTNVGINTNYLVLNGVTSNESGYYKLVFTANANSITSSVAQLTVYGSPGIGAAVASPGSTVSQGTMVTVSCTTNGGAPPYSLQWQTGPDGVTYTNIIGATSMPLSLGAVTPANAGYYQCIYTAGGLSVTSAPALLTVNTAPPVLGFTHGVGSLTLNWNSGMLLQATNVAGPWATNTEATSPYLITPIGPRMFYRLLVP
jgi:hypothetical protein